MIYRSVYLIFLLVLVNLFSSCRKDIDDFINPEKAEVKDLKIPRDFKFETHKTISVNIVGNENGQTKKCLIYAVEDLEDQLIATKFVSANDVSFNITIPEYTNSIKIVTDNGNGNLAEEYLDVFANEISTSLSSSGATAGCSDHLYAVNGQKGFYKIDVENYGFNDIQLPNLVGGGSVACAVNKDSSFVFYNTGKTLRYYNYNSKTFHSLSVGNPFNGSYPRMEYDHTSGHLFIGKNSKMFEIEPHSNNIIQEYFIKGLEAPTGGGDLAISKDGSMYLACFSGLYKLRLDLDTAYATRISAENLPFRPTSMAIDRNDRLYLATNESNSRLIEMDKVDGSWQVLKTYPYKINDLGSYKCSLNQLTQNDDDGDGVINQLDDYPSDPEISNTTYTPSELGWGTLAYEDLWPSKGDYDFNDLVVNYRFLLIENAQNEIVRIKAKFQVKAIGASYHNGFGFKMDLNPSLIKSVSGYNLTENIVSLNNKGLENGHSNGSTIIVFDDAYDNIGSKTGGFVNTDPSMPEVETPIIEIVIELENPISNNLITAVPFNSFIFINGERGRELHLADNAPTDLMDNSYFGTAQDNSDPANGVYYRTANNMPWGINIIHNFRQSVEKASINKGYNYFNNWSVSGGTEYSDWYKDNYGYRNTNYLFIK